MIDIRKIVARTIEENGLLKKGDVVVVAVSGGADSVALLGFLEEAREEFGLELIVAHFNHHLRGRASDGDEEFVSSMAEARRLRLRCGGADVKKEARERGASVEDTARDLRYDFLMSVAAGAGARKVALGHTSDDLAETFLMRLLRGAGPGGLVPMEPAMERGEVTVIRPLLEVRHAQIVAHLRDRSIPYRLDRSNFSSAYFRNKVRLELIPSLEAGYGPGVSEALVKASRGLSEVRDFIEREVATALEERVDGGGEFVSLRLGGLHPAIASGVVRAVLRTRGIPYSRDKIEEVLAIAMQGRGSVDLGSSFRAVGEGERVVLLKGKKEKTRPATAIAVPGKTVAGPFTVETSFKKRARVKRGADDLARTWVEAFEGGRLSCEAYLDYGSLEEPLVLRSRRAGDRFRPTGMRASRKLKDILIDEKVPRRLRDGIPVLVSGEEIVWVVGYRIGEKYKVHPDTKRICAIKVTAEGAHLW